MNALIEKALSKPSKTPATDIPSDDEVGLALAFLQRQITGSQYAFAVGKKTVAYSDVVTVLRKAIAADRLTISQS